MNFVKNQEFGHFDTFWHSRAQTVGQTAGMWQFLTPQKREKQWFLTPRKGGPKTGQKREKVVIPRFKSRFWSVLSRQCDPKSALFRDFMKNTENRCFDDTRCIQWGLDDVLTKNKRVFDLKLTLFLSKTPTQSGSIVVKPSKSSKSGQNHENYRFYWQKNHL